MRNELYCLAATLQVGSLSRPIQPALTHRIDSGFRALDHSIYVTIFQTGDLGLGDRRGAKDVLFGGASVTDRQHVWIASLGFRRMSRTTPHTLWKIAVAHSLKLPFCLPSMVVVVAERACRGRDLVRAGTQQCGSLSLFLFIRDANVRCASQSFQRHITLLSIRRSANNTV